MNEELTTVMAEKIEPPVNEELTTVMAEKIEPPVNGVEHTGSAGYAPYMGVKLVEAHPMHNFQTGDAGYKVRYPDGCESWCPKAAFEAAYLPLDPEDPTRITARVVRDFMPDTLNTIRMGNHTVGHVSLRNGFSIVEDSACVDEANYDEVLGARLIYEKANKQAWAFLGFVLAWAKNGLASPTPESDE